MHFCEHCGAPLTSHATMDPFATVFAEGYAARQVLHKPARPIIVIGIWAWMLPVALISMAGLLFALFSFIEGLLTLDYKFVIAGILTALPSAVIFYIAWSILSRVTRKAMQEKAQESGDAATTIDGTESPSALAETEPLTCLTCSQLIPAGSARCPACGWSYSDGEESQSTQDAEPR
jgi:hypothetical protein